MATAGMEVSPHPLVSVRALTVLGTSVGLGVAANLLLRDIRWGLGFPVWVAGCLLAGTVLWRRSIQPLSRSAAWMVAPMLVFAACLAWRDSAVLRSMNLFAFFMALAILVSQVRQGQIAKLSFGGLVGGWLAHGLLTLVDAGHLAFRDVCWQGLGNASGRERLRIAARGTLIAVPILLVFGGLLGSADPVFSNYLSRLFNWDPELFWLNFIGTLIGTWVVASIMRRMFLAPEPATSPEIWNAAIGAPPPRQLPRVPAASSGPPVFQIGAPATPPRPKWAPGIGNGEASIVLGSLILLLGAFATVQVRFLFGGAAALPDGMNWSQYARSGFFQLLAVLVLAVPVLRLVHCGLKARGANGWTYPTLAGVVVGLLGIVVASALRRLGLCIEHYGLSELRLYGGAAMVWIATCLGLLLATLFTRRPQAFVFGTVLIGFVTILALNVMNPDAMIARSMLERPARGKKLDTDYLMSLSADAVPVIARRLEGLPKDLRLDVRSRLAERAAQMREPDWRAWSLGDDGAREALNRLDNRTL